MEEAIANVYSFEESVPVVDPDSYVHPTSTLIGDVIVGARCFVGPGAVMRGDLGPLVMEPGSNLQDNCVIHTTPGINTVLAEGCIVGHGAILHGCRVGRRALIGMNAVVMDEAEIGEHAFVGALALVPARFKVPPRMLAFGSPVRLRRPLSEQEIAWLDRGSQVYQELTARYKQSLLPCSPLEKIETAQRQRRKVGGG
jgi:phenylacetic acid degradation protein